MDRMQSDRTMLMVRILITLLILAMLLPGWGLLSAATLVERTPTVTHDSSSPETVGKVSPLNASHATGADSMPAP